MLATGDPALMLNGAGEGPVSAEWMLPKALWLKRNGFRPDQVQAFLPTPMAIASAMYHTGRNPLKKVTKTSEKVSAVKRAKQRRLHKAFLRYHDPDNWPLLREALKSMGRADLIGNGRRHLVPSFQPAGTGGRREGTRSPGGRRGAVKFRTQHVRASNKPDARRRKKRQ